MIHIQVFIKIYVMTTEQNSDSKDYIDVDMKRKVDAFAT